MKKFLLITFVLLIGFTLSACKDDDTDDPVATECADDQTLVDGVCVDDDDDTDPVADLDYDVDAIFTTYISGVTNINPYNQMMATSSEIFTYVTDSLYMGDYDWAKAIDEGLATEVGDFATSGAVNLPYGRLPAMAVGEPVDVLGDGTVWEITLREDLVFEDGTAIDANTFVWSWSQLLDPDQLNIRGSVLYADTSLPVLNAEAYYKQKTPDKDSYGYDLYTLDDTADPVVYYARENSYYGGVIGHADWDLYHVALDSPWASGKLVGPNGEDAYLEDWGCGLADCSEAYGDTYKTSNGTTFYLETETGDTFMVDADDVLYAPEAGWLLDDVAVPVVDEDDDYIFAGADPAYALLDGVPVAVDADGIPVGAETTYFDATEVTWDEVGIKAKSDFVLEITLNTPRTAWDVKGNLLSGITGVVHQVQYELGLNDSGTSTTYGTIDNQLISYGVYNMTTWQAETLFIFDINDSHYDAENNKIKHIRYEFISDQSIAVEEFKLGNLDLVSASGDYFDDFEFSPGLKLTPGSTFFRFAFNIAGPDGYDANPILADLNFRQAFYYAIDREEFVTEVNSPGYPTQGLLGPIYLSTEFNSVAYRSSEAGLAIFADLSSETSGFNPVLARELFDLAYAKLVTDEVIELGDNVSVEYKMYDAETNWKLANWVKSTVEGIFNDPTASPRFTLNIVAVSSDAIGTAWDNGDFEMTFGGWTGYDFNAPKMLGEVYNTFDEETMLEVGFDTENAEVSVVLEASYDALTAWVVEYDAMSNPTEIQTDSYNDWIAMLDDFDDATKEISCTYHELFVYAYGALYNVNDINYDGKTDDFDAITATLEAVLLDQMINIPLFTRVAATVYSNRIIFEADSFHPWMGWGGMRYMYIEK